MLRPVLLSLLILFLLLMIFEERLIFFPAPYDGSTDWNPSGLEYQDVHFQAEDGTKLHGWYCPHKSPRAVILFSHGNAGNLANPDRVAMARRLNHMGVSVLLYDYRGYGRSEGSPNEEGVLQDARAARAMLAELAGVGQADIVLMGRSLGGGVAVDLAAKDGARGLILESTFTSVPDVGALHYPWIPVKMIARTRLDSLSKIKNYHGPLLQSHGEMDRMIPHDFGKKLFAEHPGVDGKDKQFITIENAGHNDPQSQSYYELLDQFLGNLPQDNASR